MNQDVKQNTESRVPDSIVEELFQMYGPEGAWELADKLKKRAMEDYSDSMYDCLDDYERDTTDRTDT